MKRSRKKRLEDKLRPLSWQLIECKLLYYYPEMVHDSWWSDIIISDDEYDKLEKDYLRYTFALKLQNFNVHKIHFDWQTEEFQKNSMFEVDFARPSVQLVCSKLGKPKMTNTEELEDREDQPHVGWVPRVLTGGKGPPDTPSDDWLTPLEVHTTFVCRQSSTSQDGELYHILFKGEKFTLLKWCLPDGKMWDRYVSPTVFCKHYKDFEVLGVNKPPKEEEETNDDEQRDRPDRSPDVVLDAPVS